MNAESNLFGQNSISLACLGRPAKRVIASARNACLIGITSHGLFLLVDGEEVLFLTHEPFRGPLTLNLSEPLAGSSLMQLGDPVFIQDTGIFFPQGRQSISLVGALVWQPPGILPGALRPAELKARISQLQERQPARWIMIESNGLESCAQALRSGSVQAAGALKGFLGRGPGLTPQGDDFILGLLLALNRWQKLFPTDVAVEAINQEIVWAARRQTTALSASLIACAAEAQADERLVRALDGLVTGTPEAEECAALFQDWGSTSGWVAFQGMAMAFTTWSFPWQQYNNGSLPFP